MIVTIFILIFIFWIGFMIWLYAIINVNDDKDPEFVEENLETSDMVKLDI